MPRETVIERWKSEQEYERYRDVGVLAAYFDVLAVEARCAMAFERAHTNLVTALQRSA